MYHSFSDGNFVAILQGQCIEIRLVSVFFFVVPKQFIIHEENTKEIVSLNESLCVINFHDDLHKSLP